jgi:hypothetical protein
MFIRMKLTSADFSNPTLRYSESCDCVQSTPDKGETWYDSPANDPRTSILYQLPHLTGSDVKCRAAEGMTKLIRQLVDQRIELDTQIEIAGGILGIVAFIPGFNVLYALILAFAAIAVTIARELLEAAFTEDDYDQIRCIFLCAIDSNGVMDAAAFANAYARMEELNDLARTWCQVAMDTFGYVGFTDAGISLEAAADCDECSCSICYKPSSNDNFPQAPCTAPSPHMLYDSVGAYSNIIYPSLQGGYVDLSAFVPLPTGAIGWLFSMNWIDGAIAELQYMTAIDPSGGVCGYGAVNMTITSGLQQSVPSDHPVVFCSWFGSSSLHVTLICAEPEFP